MSKQKFEAIDWADDMRPDLSPMSHLVSVSGLADYTASKAALEGYVKRAASPGSLPRL